MREKSSPEAFMRRAVQLSRRGYPAPNPHVGCVIARGGEIVGEGWHAYAGGPHAEIVALNRAGSKARGAEVYVTLEPCNHRGKTGPCTDALVKAEVRNVIAACTEPNPGAKGGLQRLSESGLGTGQGLLSEEAAEANRVWLTAMALGRPFVAVKAAVSLDARIAHPNGESRWITGEPARKAAHRLRAEMGAVLVGRRTAEIDDPRLTSRIPGVRNQPLRIVLDPGRGLSGQAAMLQGGRAIRVVEEALVQGENELGLGLVDGSFDLNALMGQLWEHGVTSLLVEGGGTTIGSFFRAGLIDRLDLFFAPIALGGGPSWLENAPVKALEGAYRPLEAKWRHVGADLWFQGWMRPLPA